MSRTKKVQDLGRIFDLRGYTKAKLVFGIIYFVDPVHPVRKTSFAEIQ